MKLTVANVKGGTGKTTTAVYLAQVLSDTAAAVVLVDADRQGSALAWADMAEEADEPLGFEVVSLATRQLGNRVGRLQADHVVIDCGPGDADIMAQAIEVADLVLVPAQPRLADLQQVTPVIDQALNAGTPAAVLLSRTRARTRSLAGALEALEAADVPVLETVVPEREGIGAAYGLRPQSLAPFDAVMIELEGVLNAV